MRIDGKEIASGIYEDLKERVGELQKKNITPHLVVILVGDDPASTKYVEQKHKRGTEIGAIVTVERLDKTITQEQLVKKIEQINQDPFVHGIIIQRPLPDHIDHNVISEAVAPQKDVDGFHSKTPFVPPIVLSAMRMLEEARRDVEKETKETNETNNDNPFVSSGPFVPSVSFLEWLKTQQIVLIGKGEAGGGPIIEYFRQHNIPFQIVDSKTSNPDEITKQANIIITSVGKPNIVSAENIKPGVILVGIGLYKKDDGKLAGDYSEDEIKEIAGCYTPSPGGMGPVNVAMLLTNLLESAEKTH